MTGFSRRDLMKGMAIATALGTSSGQVSARTTDAAGLDGAYNVAGGLYVGPESSLDDVRPNDGRLYIPTDVDDTYCGDGRGWSAVDLADQTRSMEGLDPARLQPGAKRSTVAVVNEGNKIRVFGPNGVIYNGDDGLEAIKTALDTGEKAVVLAGETIEVDISDPSRWMEDPDAPFDLPNENQVVFGWETETSLYCAPNTWIRVTGAPPGGRNIFLIRPSNVADIEVDVNVDGNAPELDYSVGNWTNKLLILVSIGHHRLTPRAKVSVRAENFNYYEQLSGDDDLAGVGVQTGLNAAAAQVTDSYFRRGDTALWLTTEFDGTRADEIVSNVHVADCGRGSHTHSQRAVYVEAGNYMTVSNLTILNSKNPLTVFDIAGLAGDTSHLLLDSVVIRDGTGQWGMHLSGFGEAAKIEVNDFILANQAGNGIIVGSSDNVHLANGRVESCGEHGIDVRQASKWLGISDVDLVDNGAKGLKSVNASHLSLANVRALGNGDHGISALGGDIDASLNNVHAWNNNQNDSDSAGILLETGVTAVNLTTGDGQDTQTQETGINTRFVDDFMAVTGGRVASNQSVSFTGGDRVYNVAGVDLGDVSDGVIVDGRVSESADSSSPQGTYPAGTWVDFTDTSSGSGTGWYVANHDGTFVGPLS